MSKQYYIVSVKHTDRRDSALTLWRPNDAGYCWFQEWAGVYSKKEAMEIYHPPDAIMIEKEFADRFMVKTIYDGAERMVLPNSSDVRATFGLAYFAMKSGCRSCYMALPDTAN